MLEIELLDQPQQWDRLKEEWDDVVASSDDDNPFRRWLWVRTWWKYFGRDKSLAILLAREEGRLHGIAPLFLAARALPFVRGDVGFLGATEVCSEYLGLVIRRGYEEQIVPAFMQFLFDRWGDSWDVLRWTDIPANSRQITLIDEFIERRQLSAVKRDGAMNHLVQFASTWEAYCAALPAKHRGKLRRILREFEDREDVELEVVENTGQLSRCWDELRELHNRRRAELGQQGCFVDPRFDAFHTELVREYARREMLVLGVLRVAGRAVAGCYGIRLGETVYEYQRGSNPEWIKQRPGHALQFFLFERMIRRGVRTWDYLRGDYRHKRDWSNDARHSIDFVISAPRRVPMARFYLERGFRGTRSRLGRLRRSAAEWFGELRRNGR